MQRGGASSNAGSSRSSRPSSRRSSISASSSAANTERSSNKNGAKQVNIGFGKYFNFNSVNAQVIQHSGLTEFRLNNDQNLIHSY
jgi:hypothetical protein